MTSLFQNLTPPTKRYRCCCHRLMLYALFSIVLYCPPQANTKLNRITRFATSSYYPDIHIIYLIQQLKKLFKMKFIDVTYCLISFCLLVIQNEYFCYGYSINNNNGRSPSSSSSSSPQTHHKTISRQNFLAIMAGGITATSVCGGNSMAAWAAKDASKGTKDDPTFQACLSQCKLYSPSCFVCFSRKILKCFLYFLFVNHFFHSNYLLRYV